MDNYNLLFSKCLELAPTYQFLPKEDVDYPFIVVNTSYEGYIPTKSGIIKPINLKVEKFQVDVWCTERNRTRCSQIIEQLLYSLGKKVDYTTTSYEIGMDTSTEEILWRGVLKVSLR